MKRNWKKIMIPTIIIAVMITFYFCYAAPILSRPDLSEKTKMLVMVIPIFLACIIIGIVLTKDFDEKDE